MSLDINVYTKTLTDDLIPKIIKRLNEYEMKVEVHPEFSFNSQTGFLPFKFCFTNTKFNVLKNKDLISGFELYIDDFDLEKEKQEFRPKQSFFERLLGKKQEEVYFESAEIDKRLEECKKKLTFVIHSGDDFELRFAMLTSSILTELTNGVCFNCQEGIWYDNLKITETAFEEIKGYENSLEEDEINFHLFENW